MKLAAFSLRLRTLLVAILMTSMLWGQSSPAIDSLLLALEQNAGMHNFCGHPCQSIELELKRHLSEQYFVDGYPEKGLKLASKSVYIDGRGQLNGEPGWDLFLSLLSRYYATAELNSALKEAEVFVDYDEFLNMIELSPKDLAVSEDKYQASRWNGLADVYIKFDQLLLLVLPYGTTVDDYNMLLAYLFGEEEDKKRFEGSILRRWTSSSLYQDILNLTK